MSLVYGQHEEYYTWISVVGHQPVFILAGKCEGEDARSYYYPAKEMAELIKPLEQFKATPWRQYWAFNPHRPEIVYLGEFDAPTDAQEALDKSGHLRTDEMQVVNCTGAASLMVSAKEVMAMLPT